MDYQDKLARLAKTETIEREYYFEALGQLKSLVTMCVTKEDRGSIYNPAIADIVRYIATLKSRADSSVHWDYILEAFWSSWSNWNDKPHFTNREKIREWGIDNQFIRKWVKDNYPNSYDTWIETEGAFYDCIEEENDNE